MTFENLRKDLEKLRRSHVSCGDEWYSCPKSDGYYGDAPKDRCDCGADEHNAILDRVLKSIALLEDFK